MNAIIALSLNLICSLSFVVILTFLNINTRSRYWAKLVSWCLLWLNIFLSCLLMGILVYRVGELIK